MFDEVAAQRACTSVRVLVWGATAAERHFALLQARRRPWSGGLPWKVAEVESLGLGVPCPVDVCDPAALAAESDYGWAYAVYPAAADSDR